jgi:hypothetical protein
MRICDIEGWPPTLTDSYSSQQTLPASAPAKLKRCRMFSVAGSSTPYLSIIVEFQDRDWHAMIVDQPESLLTRIEATLRGHEGEALANLGDLEIIEIP